jgi:hypothetical protein
MPTKIQNIEIGAAGDGLGGFAVSEAGPKGPKDMHRNPNTRALNRTTNHGPEPASSDRPIQPLGTFADCGASPCGTNFS